MIGRTTTTTTTTTMSVLVTIFLLAAACQGRLQPRSCLEATDSAKPCVQKCCEPDQKVVDGDCGSVVDGPLGRRFEIPKFVDKNGTRESYEAEEFNIVSGRLRCLTNETETFLMNPLDAESEGDDDDFKITEDGCLQTGPGEHVALPGQFCLEEFPVDNGYQVLAYVCAAESPPDTEQHGLKIYHILSMALSLPFLLATFFVYALVKKLQNLHGKSLMCHVATLLVAYAGLLAVQFITNIINLDVCVVLAFVIQFSFLASFFWLNVMCVDLWWTFSGFRPLKGNLKQHESRKFLYYSIYAWGCTSLISIVTFCMQRQWFFASSNEYRPEFGKINCWFGSKTATLLYFYGPIGTLLICNLLMFLYTAIMIAKKIKDTEFINKADCQRNINHEKQKFVLYLKLFIVMGVNWVAEILSWHFQKSNEFQESSLWCITDIGNALQGVLIFLIFVCKKRTLKLLAEKLCPKRKLFATATSSTRTHYSSTISKITNVSSNANSESNRITI